MAQHFKPEEYAHFQKAQELAQQAQLLLHQAMEELCETSIDTELQNRLAVAFSQAGSVKRVLRSVNQEVA